MADNCRTDGLIDVPKGARLLKHDERDRVARLVPDYELPEHAAIPVVEDGERILSFAVVHAVLHSEPFWVAPELRGGEFAGHAIRDIGALIEREIVGCNPYYCFSPFPRADELLAAAGFDKQPWTVWRRTPNRGDL